MLLILSLIAMESRCYGKSYACRNRVKALWPQIRPGSSPTAKALQVESWLGRLQWKAGVTMSLMCVETG